MLHLTKKKLAHYHICSSCIQESSETESNWKCVIQDTVWHAGENIQSMRLAIYQHIGHAPLLKLYP